MSGSALTARRAFRRRLIRANVAAAIANRTTTPATTAPAKAPGEIEPLEDESELLPPPAVVEAALETDPVAVARSSLLQLICIIGAAMGILDRVAVDEFSALVLV